MNIENDILYKDVVESYSNEASSASFGWDFQYSAGVFLFLRFADKAVSIAMENDMQDIDILMDDNTHVYAQAKSSQDYTAMSVSDKKSKIGDALISLSNTYSKDDSGIFIYVSNVVDTLPYDDFSKNSVVCYKDLHLGTKYYINDLIKNLVDSMKNKIEKIKKDKRIKKEAKDNKINRINFLIQCLNSFDVNRFYISTIVPFRNDDENRYKVIKESLIGFLNSKLKIEQNRAIMISNRYAEFLKYTMSERSGIKTGKGRKNMHVSELVWPVVSYMVFDDISFDEVKKAIDFKIDLQIKEDALVYLKNDDLFMYHSRFQFSNVLIQKYFEYKKHNPAVDNPDVVFVKNNWLQFRDEFESDVLNPSVIGDETFEVIVKWFLLKLLSKNNDAQKIIDWLGEERRDY